MIGFDRSKKPNFSIKAMQISEEKQAVAQYGSSDSGASLGDILGAALKEAAKPKPTTRTAVQEGERSEGGKGGVSSRDAAFKTRLPPAKLS